MAHHQQIQFCKSVKEKYPQLFKKCNVLDIGSMDINGNNRYLFEDYTYVGVDLGLGPNVDVISKGHEYSGDVLYDVVISTECFEHDMYWDKTILNCANQTKPGGIFLFTCASTGRNEHGTAGSGSEFAAPHSSRLFNNHYRNITIQDIEQLPGFLKQFIDFDLIYNKESCDLYFYGIKR